MERVIKIQDTQGTAFMFKCPGCAINHLVPTKYLPGKESIGTKVKPTWAFNGNMERPSFKPDFVVEWRGAEPPQRCRAIIRDGWLIFLTDSTHKLSGQRIEMHNVNEDE